MKKTKVICIGVGNTGTVSLSQAMRVLGYRSIHLGADKRKGLFPNGSVSEIRQAFSEFDFITDYPVWQKWRRCVEVWPDAKFILTTRDVEAYTDGWLVHALYCRVKLGQEWPKNLNVAKSRRDMAEHNAAVREFFRGSPNFLDIDLTKTPDQYAVLCEFLKCKHPQQAFPKSNTKRMKLQEIYRVFEGREK